MVRLNGCSYLLERVRVSTLWRCLKVGLNIYDQGFAHF